MHMGDCSMPWQLPMSLAVTHMTCLLLPCAPLPDGITHPCNMPMLQMTVIGATMGAWGKEKYGMKPKKVEALEFLR